MDNNDKLKNIINEAVRDALHSTEHVQPYWRMGLKRITEANLNRIIKQGESGMIVISANRSEISSTNPNADLNAQYDEWLSENGLGDTEENKDIFLRERNKEANKELNKAIKDSGLSYTPVYGGYHGSDLVQDDMEPSYIVYAKDRRGETVDFDVLFNLAKEWCSEFNQDSVYVQPPFEAPMYMDSEGRKVSSSSSLDFKYNRDDEMFYTTTKRKKTNPHRFTADINFESFYHKGVSSFNERIMRIKRGEFLLG